MRPIKNITWNQYGDLIVLWVRENRTSWWKNKIYEKVLCKCWKEYFTRREHLMWWRINNCWCTKTERAIELWKNNTEHWLTWTRIFVIFWWITQRCNNKNTKAYKNYWWRWIKCDWNKFIDFYNDMNESYMNFVKKNWENNTTIDRINVNWNYSKDNCRWATMKEQWRNRRNNRIVNYNWKEYVLSALEELWHGNRIVSDRLKRWWDVESALINPKITKEKWISVTQYDANWNIIAKYASIRNASYKTWICRNIISKCINGDISNTGGFIWKSYNRKCFYADRLQSYLNQK